MAGYRVSFTYILQTQGKYLVSPLVLIRLIDYQRKYPILSTITSKLARIMHCNRKHKSMYVCMCVCVCMCVFYFFVMKNSLNILRLHFGQPEARASSMHVVRRHSNFPIISGYLFLCYTGNNQSWCPEVVGYLPVPPRKPGRPKYP
jgi:hypothetical protein